MATLSIERIGSPTLPTMTSNVLEMPPAPTTPEYVEQLSEVTIEELKLAMEVEVDGYRGEVQLISEPYINVLLNEGEGSTNNRLRLVHTGRTAVQRVVLVPTFNEQ